MSINFIGPEEINRRKTISDNKNNTDALTFTKDGKPSSHGVARKQNSDRRDLLEIEAIKNQTDEQYYDELLKGD